MRRWLRAGAIGLNWAVALAWSARTVYWLRGVRRVPNLLHDEVQAEAEAALPTISVIVPARDEERGVEACLRSLLRSEGVALQVIAVDDRSADATGSIMDAVAAEASACGRNMEVLHLRELPAGWTGKTHAMSRAVESATGAWLLFTDADVIFREDALERALRFAVSEAADHVVVIPTVICGSFGERMMMSFLLATAIWSAAPWRVADPKAKKHAIGIGAFNLVRRETYDAIGGWPAMRMEVVEDMRFGHVIKQRGLRQRVAYGPGLLRIRWAEGALGVVRNLTKNAFAVFRFRVELAAMAAAALLITCVYPVVGVAGPRAMQAASALTSASWLALYVKQRQESDAHLGYVLAFPVAACFLFGTLVSSIVQTLRQGGVTWRGTHYALKDLRAASRPLR